MSHESLQQHLDTFTDESADEASENRERVTAEQRKEKGTFTRAPGEGLGAGYHNDGSRQDIRLIGSSITRRFKTTSKQRRRAVNRVMRAIDEGNDMSAIKAAAVLVAMERADNARLFAPGAGKIGPQSPQVNVTIQVAAREAAVFGEINAFRRAAAHGQTPGKQGNMTKKLTSEGQESGPVYSESPALDGATEGQTGPCDSPKTS